MNVAANSVRAHLARIFAIRERLPFQEFAQAGALGAVLLFVATALALAWANSPWSDSYFHLWSLEFAIGPAHDPLAKSLGHWINDGLMSVFFLLVGLEIKRELLVGELASLKQALFPVAAAVGGMIVPALVFLAMNGSGAGRAGWGIPMATDIAFALGVLTLLGPRVPIGLKIFLTAFAIVDDLGAVLVIALFYTSTLNLPALLFAGVALGTLIALNVAGTRALSLYLIVGVVLWLALLTSGVHATISGVLIALTIPVRTRVNAAEFAAGARGLLADFERAETGDLLVITSKGQQEAIHALEAAGAEAQGPLLRLERSLHGVVAYGILPLFALSNAGVRFEGMEEALASNVTLGAATGLLFGKPVGIMLFTWLAVRTGMVSLPAGVTWSAVHGAAWLGGIGFTMSIFIARLAFGDSELNDAAKSGVLLSSAMASVVGAMLVRRACRRPPEDRIMEEASESAGLESIPG
jgi:NhaA family Na+:H+ antiporter